MDASGTFCLISFVVLIGGLLILQSYLGRSILSDLRIEETVETRLPRAQVKETVRRAMKGAMGVLVPLGEGEDFVERQFSYNLRKQTYTVTLRASIDPSGERGVHEVTVAVTSLRFPTMFGIPSFGTSFRKAAKIRRRVVQALMQADPSARRAVDHASWENSDG